MKLDTVPPRHKEWVISGPESNNSALEVSQFEIIFWLPDRWEYSLFNQLILDPLRWLEKHLFEGEKWAYMIELSCILRGNLVSSFKEEAWDELLGPYFY